MALLELSQAGVNLVEFTHFMSQQLEQDQDSLDLVEEKVAQARETTRQAVSGQKKNEQLWPTKSTNLMSVKISEVLSEVVTLTGATSENGRERMLLWPGAGLVMLGGLVFFTCPVGAPAAICAAGRGSI